MTTMANFEPCKHRTVCGGCKYNGMVYEETLAAKDKEVLIKGIEMFENPKINVPISFLLCG